MALVVVLGLLVSIVCLVSYRVYPYDLGLANDNMYKSNNG